MSTMEMRYWYCPRCLAKEGIVRGKTDKELKCLGCGFESLLISVGTNPFVHKNPVGTILVVEERPE